MPALKRIIWKSSFTGALKRSSPHKCGGFHAFHPLAGPQMDGLGNLVYNWEL